VTWFLAGGFPMVFIAVFGAALLASAVGFARAPGDGRWGHLAAQGLAVLLVAVAGTAVDLIAVSVNVPAHPEWHDQLALVVLRGVGEALVPLVAGCAVVAAAALVSSVGLRRAGA
jgi:hypothetical protein